MKKDTNFKCDKSSLLKQKLRSSYCYCKTLKVKNDLKHIYKKKYEDEKCEF